MNTLRVKESNTHVAKWLSERSGERTPIHSPGSFESYSTSRASCCWGQPLGGMNIDGTNIWIAVASPSPIQKGDSLVLFYDYVLK